MLIPTSKLGILGLYHADEISIRQIIGHPAFIGIKYVGIERHASAVCESDKKSCMPTTSPIRRDVSHVTAWPIVVNYGTAC
jgi:hypothetical protein